MVSFKLIATVLSVPFHQATARGTAIGFDTFRFSRKASSPEHLSLRGLLYFYILLSTDSLETHL